MHFIHERLEIGRVQILGFPEISGPDSGTKVVQVLPVLLKCVSGCFGQDLRVKVESVWRDGITVSSVNCWRSMFELSIAPKSEVTETTRIGRMNKCILL